MRLGFLIEYYKQVKISIHAPLTGCDDEFGKIRIHCTISIHAPLTGCDVP